MRILLAYCLLLATPAAATPAAATPPPSAAQRAITEFCRNHQTPPCPRCSGTSPEERSAQAMLGDPAHFDCYHLRCRTVSGCDDWKKAFENFCADASADRLKLCRLQKQDDCLLTAVQEHMAAEGMDVDFGSLEGSVRSEIKGRIKDLLLALIKDTAQNVASALSTQARAEVVAGRLGKIFGIVATGDRVIQLLSHASVLAKWESCEKAIPGSCEQEAFDRLTRETDALSDRFRSLCTSGCPRKPAARTLAPRPDGEPPAPGRICACPITDADKKAGYEIITEDPVLEAELGRDKMRDIIPVCCSDPAKCPESRCTLRNQKACESPGHDPTLFPQVCVGCKKPACEARTYP